MPRTASHPHTITSPQPTPHRPAVSELLRALTERRRRRAMSLRRLSAGGAGA